MATPTVEHLGLHPFDLGGVKSVEIKRHLGDPKSIWAEVWGKTEDNDQWRVLSRIPGQNITVVVTSLSKQILETREALLNGERSPDPEIRLLSSMSAERQVKLARRINHKWTTQLQIGFDPDAQEFTSLRFRNL